MARCRLSARRPGTRGSGLQGRGRAVLRRPSSATVRADPATEAAAAAGGPRSVPPTVRVALRDSACVGTPHAREARPVSPPPGPWPVAGGPPGRSPGHPAPRRRESADRTRIRRPFPIRVISGSPATRPPGRYCAERDQSLSVNRHLPRHPKKKAPDPSLRSRFLKTTSKREVGECSRVIHRAEIFVEPLLPDSR